MKGVFCLAFLSAMHATRALSLSHDSLPARHSLLLSVSELLNGSFGAVYRYEFAHHRLGVLVPVSAGFGVPSFSNSSRNSSYDNDHHITDVKYTRKVFDVAAGINYHTNPTGPFTYFVGLLAGVSQFNGSCNYYGLYSLPSSAQGYHYVMTSYYGMINNGFIIRINKRLEVLAYLAAGLKVDNYSKAAPPGLFQQSEFKYLAGDIPSPFSNVKIGFSVGYRF